MSYELWFWIASSGCPHEPDEIVGRLCEGGQLEGLHELDFNHIRAGLKELFPGFDRDFYESENVVFTLSTYVPYAFTINISSLQSDMSGFLYDMWGAAGPFDYTTYDPQSGEIIDI